ncbi:MAG: glutaminyl-peptide cyclotransferase [Flavobacteriaceae bacterium]|jgi:glutaminyl-peptide cyclotransferase
MSFRLIFLVFCISLLSYQCGNKNQALGFKLDTNIVKKTLSLGDTLVCQLSHPELAADSIVFKLDGKAAEASIPLVSQHLGDHRLEATVFVGERSEVLMVDFTLLNSSPPKILEFEIVNTYPHDINAYTQGLEFINDSLYESTGQYGFSSLRLVDLKTGKVLKSHSLPKAYFGEGLTILDDKLVQLTWQSGIGLVYDRGSFEQLESFSYQKSKEGWGLCNDGTQIFKSDGTDKIFKLNSKTFAEEGYIQATTNKGKLNGINELEWVNGKIYANRYQYEGIAIIDPTNGAVVGVLDCRTLKPQVTQHQKLDVLNGIAYRPSSDTFFVTGKYWDKMFEIKLK